MPPLQPQTGTATTKDTQQGQTTQLVGQMADAAGTQSTALIAALEAVRAAIAAKPSA